MNETELQNDIEGGELLDEGLQEQSQQLEELQGSMEALSLAIVADSEPVKLTEHQQERVNDFKTLQHEHPGKIYAVVDQAATESFVDITIGLFQKAVNALGNEIPVQFKLTAKALKHYVDMGEKLRSRLVSLRPLLEKRDFPLNDIFDYGSYSRFFQVEGKAIAVFSEFEEAMVVQNAATRHVLRATESYSVVIAEKLLTSLQSLQALKHPDSDRLVSLRDAIERHWLQTWKEADITTNHGQTPQSALNAFPERKFVSLAPLLDNRYLVAHSPKSDGGDNPLKITEAVKHYGASLVFDKKVSSSIEKSMNVPNVEDLLKMVDQVVNVLSDMRALELLIKKNDSFAKDFQKAMVVLSKQAQVESEPQFMSFMTEYFKLTNAVVQTIQQPYVNIVWMYIRCALVVVSLVEMSVLEDPKDRFATNRLFIKQNSEFSNPALESYNVMKTALQSKQASIS